MVATVLTVYGIETQRMVYLKISSLKMLVATVLTVYGIETAQFFNDNISTNTAVATVLTVYGIETD